MSAQSLFILPRMMKFTSQGPLCSCGHGIYNFHDYANSCSQLHCSMESLVNYIQYKKIFVTDSCNAVGQKTKKCLSFIPFLT